MASPSHPSFPLPVLSASDALSLVASQIEAHHLARASLRQTLQDAHDGNRKAQAELASQIESLLYPELAWHDLTLHASDPGALRCIFLDASQAACSRNVAFGPTLDDVCSEVLSLVVAHHPADAERLDPADTLDALRAVVDRFSQYGRESTAAIDPSWRIAHDYGLFESAVHAGPIDTAQRIHSITTSSAALAPILATQSNAERAQAFFDSLRAASVLLATNTPPESAPPSLRDAVRSPRHADVIHDFRAIKSSVRIDSKEAFAHFLRAFSESALVDLMRPASSNAPGGSFPPSFAPPSNRRFGVEIEGFIASPLPRAQVYDTLRLALRRGGCLGWEVKPDATINCDLSGDCPFPGIEVVSPPLSGTHGRDQLARAMRVLHRAGLMQNQTTGVHVHVEVESPTPAQIISLLNAPRPASLQRPPSGAQLWSVPNPIPVINEHAPASPIIRTIEAACPRTARTPLGRNYAINLRPLLTQGTVEFRGVSNFLGDLPMVVHDAVATVDAIFGPPSSPISARLRSHAIPLRPQAQKENPARDSTLPGPSPTRA